MRLDVCEEARVLPKRCIVEHLMKAVGKQLPLHEHVMVVCAGGLLTVV